VALSSVELLEAKPALTKLTLLACNSSHSVVKVGIETGRFHQIRVHLAHLGHPIIGDREYGSRKTQIRRTMLHSRGIEIQHPQTKHVMRLKAALPSDMMDTINGLLARHCTFASPDLKECLYDSL